MIVATAGHIDHGKTALVKALTGVDTDRLPQEKARGISIDLGFAYWTTTTGAVIGFVDVPGHERFVRNMLAGVCGIDFALLVVAADDGVMPQTREHVSILDLLGISRGIVVITKADLADAGRLQEVVSEVDALLAGTSLAGAALLPVSSRTGAGIPSLREALAAASQDAGRRAVRGRCFRYAVDRAFTITGSGTVVTGTVFDGVVRAGDRLVLSPSGSEVRVRGIQKNGARAESAAAGERCALNLAGIELSQVQRGDWVLHPQLNAPATRLDVALRVLAGEAQALRHWTPVQLHLGTRAVTARVSLRRGESVLPGGQSFARLVTDVAVSALHGDRFILRDQSARRTMGGGTVLDARPDLRRLPVQTWRSRMNALAVATPAEALTALSTCEPEGVPVEWFRRNFNLDTDAFAQVLQACRLISVSTGEQALVYSREQLEERRLKATPAAEPQNPEHVRLWQQVQPLLRQAGRGGLSVAKLAEAARANPLLLRDMLHRRAKAGEAVRVGEERFYLSETITNFAAIARQLALAQNDGRFTAASFRDAAGVGRALAVQVLEALDREGVTRRIGDARVLCGPAARA
jgi:selenocysteine-specific elongation factor